MSRSLSSDTVHTERSRRRALGVLCVGKGLHAVTGVRKKQERRRERRLTLDEDDSNNYAAFSLEPPCSIHLNTVKRKEKKKKKPSLLSSAKNARMSVKERALMKF